MRRMQAVEMRSKHMTWMEIGHVLGVSHTTARDYVKKELSRRADELREEGALDVVRQQEAAKLDEMERLLWPRLQEERGWDKATHGLVRVFERRANLLGLDTPVVREQLNRLAIDVRLSDGSLPPGSDVVDAEVVEDVPDPPQLEAGEADPPLGG